MRPGTIVSVIGSKSISPIYLGMYGKITDNHPYKETVELYRAVPGQQAALSHTAFRSDLEVVYEPQ